VGECHLVSQSVISQPHLLCPVQFVLHHIPLKQLTKLINALQSDANEKRDHNCYLYVMFYSTSS